MRPLPCRCKQQGGSNLLRSVLVNRSVSICRMKACCPPGHRSVLLFTWHTWRNMQTALRAVLKFIRSASCRRPQQKRPALPFALNLLNPDLTLAFAPTPAANVAGPYCLL